MNAIDAVCKAVRENLGNFSEITDEMVYAQIQSELLQNASYGHLDVQEKTTLSQKVFNRMRRHDVLQPLLDDPHVSEVMVNGPSNIFVERGGKLLKTEVKFDSRERLETVIQQIVGTVNRKVNRTDPIADARLLDGSRVNVVLHPLALNGPVMTIRKFPDKPMTLDQLLSVGAMDEQMYGFVQMLVRCKYNLFISGGTGSGKTTLLNALSASIPKDERMITIEDSAELQIQGVENLIQLEARQQKNEGKSAIAELIRASLRMRPDRIIVGEVRGEEAFDMLQAMNTGHEGSISTGHANSPADMLRRLEIMIQSAYDIPNHVVKSLIASAIDVVIHVSRLPDGSRKITRIEEVERTADDGWSLGPLYQYKRCGYDSEQGITGEFIACGDLVHLDKQAFYAPVDGEEDMNEKVGSQGIRTN